MSVKTIRKISKYIRSYKHFLIVSIFSAVISVVCTLLAPVIIGKAIDSMSDITHIDFYMIKKSCIFLLITILAGAVSLWLLNFSAGKLTQNIINDLRKDTLKKIFTLPVSAADHLSEGDFTAKIVTDIENIGDGLTQTISQFLTSICTVLGTVIFMLSINVKIALLVIIITPISVLVSFFITRGSRKYFIHTSNLRGDLSDNFSEFAKMQDEIELFAANESIYNQFNEVNKQLEKVNFKSQFYISLANPSTRFVNNIIYTAVGVFGAFAAISGGLSIGSIACFLTYAAGYTKPFNEITAVAGEISTALSSAKRVFDLIESRDDLTDQNELTLTNFGGKIDFVDISFSYDEHTSFIQNLNLSIKPAQKVAIVGKTGSGKTTIINLLMRFLEPSNGKILFSDQNVLKASKSSLREKYGVVLQEPWVFCGTVYENIIFGNEESAKDDAIHAAKMAYADSFIRLLPNGYDTVIGEDDNLSTGQKQLICISRIICKNPDFLILDEATSNIDFVTEKYISRVFNKLSDGKTSFIVAHRLETIKDSDLILVMDNGKIVEQGSHKELMLLKNDYYKLYQSRFG